MKPDELILRPKKSKTILLALVCLVFTIGGYLITETESLKGWLITTFFGMGLVVFIIQLFPNSAQLKLTKEGFIVTSLFRGHLTKWRDIKIFKIGFLGPNKTVMFDYLDSHKQHKTGKLIAKNLSGSHGALPNTYGMKTPELLHLMNEWKRKDNTVYNN